MRKRWGVLLVLAPAALILAVFGGMSGICSRASQYPSGEAFDYPHRRLDPMEMPKAMSCRRVMPRQTTMLPGGGSCLRAR